MSRLTGIGVFCRDRLGRVPWAPMVFLASCALLAIVLLTGVGSPATKPIRSFNFFDLKVYRHAAGLMLDGQPLYAGSFGRGLGFTYPPAAAMLLTLLQVGSVRADELAVTLVNLALVAVLAHSTIRLTGGAPADDAQRSRRSAVAWVGAAGAVWTLPVTSAIGYGQIDLLIAALVVADLAFGRDARWGGLLIGAAAAIKLTPLIFIAYLALSRRPRMAARALGTFAVSIAAAFDVTPGDASAYWTGRVFDTAHITGGGHAIGRGPANQSLHGALLRIAPGVAHQPEIWVAVCVLVGIAGLLLAVSAARRGDEVWGFVLTAVTGLLICPVTWVHHGVIAVPGLLLLLDGPLRLVRGRLLVVVVLAVAAGSWSIMPVIAARPLGEHLGTLGLLAGNLYVIAGLAVLLTSAVREAAARRSARDRSWPLSEHAECVDWAATAVGAWDSDQKPALAAAPGPPLDRRA